MDVVDSVEVEDVADRDVNQVGSQQSGLTTAIQAPAGAADERLPVATYVRVLPDTQVFVMQVAEQRLGGKSAVAEHPDLDHINAQLVSLLLQQHCLWLHLQGLTLISIVQFGAHLCDMPAQSSPVKATDKIPPELVRHCAAFGLCPQVYRCAVNTAYCDWGCRA